MAQRQWELRAARNWLSVVGSRWSAYRLEFMVLPTTSNRQLTTFLSVRHQDHVDFDLCMQRQRGNADGRARRKGFVKIFLHHRVHHSEIGQVGQIDADASALRERVARGFAHGLEVLEHAPRLRRDIARNKRSRYRIDWSLS